VCSGDGEELRGQPHRCEDTLPSSNSQQSAIEILNSRRRSFNRKWRGVPSSNLKRMRAWLQLLGHSVRAQIENSLDMRMTLDLERRPEQSERHTHCRNQGKGEHLCLFCLFPQGIWRTDRIPSENWPLHWAISEYSGTNPNQLYSHFKDPLCKVFLRSLGQSIWSPFQA
jgi:hypothetical protein